ncbi:MAG TPA: AsnC family transcriptional regulator [Candidatus Thermoplasmatota archaeon]|nr:AsnC family transcriptional regulator [Candidatus Thermoplasmatota archaeon]
MDELDFQILTHLYEDARKPYDAIGRSVSLSGNAVKARVAKMEEEGVLKGFFGSPAPSLLGMRMCILVFQNVEKLEEREKDILKNVGSIGPVRTLDITFDNSVIVSVLHRDEEDLDAIVKRASELVGKAPGHTIGCPSCASESARDVKLGLVDWRIVKALRKDGRKALKDIVQETGASFKTVKKRLAAMLEKDALHIAPFVSTSEASGLVLFNLMVFLESNRYRHAALSALPKPYAAWPMDDPPGVSITMFRPNLRAAQEARHLVKNLPGVTRTYFKISTRYRYDQWVDEEIARRIASLERERQPIVSVPVLTQPAAPAAGRARGS